MDFELNEYQSTSSQNLLINDGNTENDTITLFKQYENKYFHIVFWWPNTVICQLIVNIKLIKCNGDDDLFRILLNNNPNINRKISSLIDNNKWVYFKSYNKFKDDLDKTRSLN